MSRLRNTLIEQYTDHYRRINVDIESASLDPHVFNVMQLRYGEFVAGLPADSRVLDLGCGTGNVLLWLAQQPNIIPIGVDSSAGQVEIAQRRLPGVDISCDDGLEYLRRNPETFGGIICTDVLEHIPGNDLCLEWVETARAALKPGGFFYCRMPNAANLTGTYSRYMDLTHERSFTSTSILQLLEAAGLEDCRIVPIQAAHLSGRIRLKAEHLLHRAIFQICGRGLERVFTSNVCAVGFKK